MEFIANISNRKIPKTILPSSDVEIDGVMAAIAYGSNLAIIAKPLEKVKLALMASIIPSLSF